MRERCDQIHNMILEYQRLSVNDFAKITQPIDISKYIESARESVKGKSFVEAIVWIAFAERPTSKTRIRSLIEEYLEEATFHALFPLAMVDSEGRRTATSPSLLDGGEETREQVIKSRMLMEATRHQQLVAAAIIQPMIEQISLEHYLKMEDFTFLVRYNNFIPPTHAFIYAKGLYAGLQSDPIVAGHLLIPQIENSLRYILNQHGVITSGLNTENGVQENYTLDTLLAMPALEEILGEDIVFDLQCLLIRRFGSNLRNRLSHGLMESLEFSSPLMIYLWWLVIHLCCRGLPHFTKEQPNTD
ncbi:MAG: DUF4209 domain-containing protein [bacterium]|nr:DUF4209 domain-containing protein [bacterium]